MRTPSLRELDFGGVIASERKVADELDAMRIRWEYEPTLFILSTNGDGHCSEGFQPDFYLPDHDLYIEVTMAKVETRKNGKIRRLREQRPDIRVVLFGRRDFVDIRGSLQRIIREQTWPGYDC